MPKLINVCAPSYSGTTMVDLMLGYGPDSFSCGEVYAWFRPFQPRHFTLQCACGEQPCPQWQQIQEGPASTFHQRVVERLGVETVVDSSKNLRWVLDSNRWATEQGLEVVNLLLWKEPISLTHSYWKRGDPVQHGRRAFVKYYSRFLETGLPFLTLSYQELTQAPADKLRQTCERIGIDYFPGKERFWEHRSHHLFGNSGTRRQMDRGESEIRAEETFPSEFWAALAGQGIDFKTDPVIQAIMRRLKEREVSRITAADMPGPGSLPKRMPAWYYIERAHIALRLLYLRASMRRAAGGPPRPVRQEVRR